MGSFFYAGIVLSVLGFILFFPFFLNLNAHYDMNRKKLCFSICIYAKIKLIGGYINAYPQGVALHVSPKKAILIRYTDLDAERKKFSFMKTLDIRAVELTTETCPEYLMGVGVFNILCQALGLISGCKRENIKTNIWLVKSDTLSISVRITWLFNGYMLLTELIRVLKEKIQILWKKKIKKSIV